MDLWWSGKHHHHGGNIQVVSAPDGWPLWTSDVRPGREHDMSAARADPDLLARIADWIGDGAPALADLGYEGEPETFTIPFKKPKDGKLTVDQQAYNALLGGLRCLGKRANSLLKTTFTDVVLRRLAHSDSWASISPRAAPRPSSRLASVSSTAMATHVSFAEGAVPDGIVRFKKDRSGTISGTASRCDDGVRVAAHLSSDSQGRTSEPRPGS